MQLKLYFLINHREYAFQVIYRSYDMIYMYQWIDYIGRNGIYFYCTPSNVFYYRHYNNFLTVKLKKTMMHKLSSWFTIYLNIISGSQDRWSIRRNYFFWISVYSAVFNYTHRELYQSLLSVFSSLQHIRRNNST